MCLSCVRFNSSLKGNILSLAPFMAFHYANTNSFIVWCIIFFLFIGREPTRWPANNCFKKIMVCSFVVPSTSDNSLLMRDIIVITLSGGKMAVRSERVFEIQKQTLWFNDKTIIELGYRSYLALLWQWLSHWTRRSISAHHWQITIFCSISCVLLPKMAG